MPRPRKEIAQQIHQQAEALKDQSPDDAAATVQEIAAEAEELATGSDVSALLDQLTDLASKARLHAEMDRGAWLQVQLLSLIDQIKAAL